MKKLAGHLINAPGGMQGDRGLVCDYLLAENGVFLEARSALLEARICIAPVRIRGLAPLEERVSLPQGKIPGCLYNLALSILYADPWRERYLAITWDGQYHLRMPAQHREEDKVEYWALPATLVDIHSHGAGKAFFSREWDDRDEQGFRLSLVAGNPDTWQPETRLRLALYGHFAPVAIEEVFACTT